MLRHSLCPAAAGLALVLAVTPAPARAQADPMIGQLAVFGFNFCPRGWAPANGQILPISSNTALFSLLGTTYGGDGRTTFALPDLRGRVAIQAGQGPGLPSFQQGDAGGTASVTLTPAQMPGHTHAATATVNATNSPATTPSPVGQLNALTTAAPAYASGPAQAMAAGSATVTVQPSGGSQAVATQPPYLALNWCVALIGIFPSRG